ncbi:MAG: glycyl-radical enzyme activating protein [Ruminococcaceae bacterium]|nr:glycyl-radical enzyme activating protein [Oscillospiraceae bacterium]
MKQPLILEIKGNSLDDGPGIRSVVFFKGCPLSCVWCHNPESKKTVTEISFSARDCIGCETCLKVCKKQALSKSNPHYIDRDKCDLCFECVEVCPAKALTRVGKEMTVDEIINRVASDKPFYNVSGGGVTLSGGEATLFPEFVGELLKRLKENEINTLVETCGQFNFEDFKKHILPFTDMIYYDLKLFDSRLHKKYCGTTNENILENFEKLFRLSQKGDFILLPRTPLIPNITDTDENLISIADFLKNLGVKRSELLSYNPTWFEKNQKLGILVDEEISETEKWQAQEKIAHCEKIYTDRGIKVRQE